MSVKQQISKQLQYKAWANRISFAALGQLPVAEQEKQRPTTFGNMLSTLDHIYIVDDIFKAHLTATEHGYLARTTPDWPTLEQIQAKQTLIDRWFLDYAASRAEADLETVVEFDYVGGGEGEMTVQDILLHLVNHGTYHHGFVSDMMYQVPARPPANDYTVFIRDIYKG